MYFVSMIPMGFIKINCRNNLDLVYFTYLVHFWFYLQFDNEYAILVIPVRVLGQPNRL